MSHGTIVDKIWDAHVIQGHAGPDAVFVDLQVLVEISSLYAFERLEQRNLPVAYPELTFGVADHAVPTDLDRALRLVPGRLGEIIQLLTENCDRHGIPMYGMNDPGHGIVHVIAPEQGRVQPGMLVVCGDSHTSTMGGLGALAFGIGSTAVADVLASQMLIAARPSVMEIDVSGTLSGGVSAKDLTLHIAAEYGTSMGAGRAIEYRGSGVRSLSMEERMSLCNMSIEIGGRVGTISPDETTFEYLAARVARVHEWPSMVERWSSFTSDDSAVFDASVSVNADEIQPMISFGTSPSMSMPVNGEIPRWSPSRTESPEQFRRALEYMGLAEGQSLLGHPINAVFIGSCANGRIEDLRHAADVLRGRRVAPGVRALVVPGSQAVKGQAEAEGLAEVFLEAGAEWHNSGCSMCNGVNGEFFGPLQYAVGTANRNFEGRQGRDVRTLLASPLTAAACAVAGKVTDPRALEPLARR
jgi:3-isopropylmalate/(R)-2-methylmalate dehydratase large subunit